MSKRKVKVSEHAMFRYLERSGRLDRKALEQELLTPGLVAAVMSGALSYKVDGVTFVIKGDTVVTVLDNARPANLTRDADLERRIAAL